MCGAGNDFVLVEGPVRGAAKLARELCDRRRGVGADGLLVVERGPKLRYLNSDGSEAFCGNGSRCAAVWLSQRGWARGKSFALASSAGELRARILGRGRAAIAMPEPRLVREAFELRAGGRAWTAQHWDTGVPHAVVVVGDLDATPVFEAGRALRSHPAFGRPGANVDFIARRPGGLAVRTYERGVEDETLACGTGVVASAAAAEALGWGRLPLKVTVRGGDTLKVFRDAGRVWLEGPAQTVFEGETR